MWTLISFEHRYDCLQSQFSTSTDQRIDGMQSVMGQWLELVSEFDIRHPKAQAILQAVQEQRSRLTLSLLSRALDNATQKRK